MTSEELVNRIGTLVALAAGLLSVSVTLVALIPTLIQLVRVHAPTFFEQLEQEGALRRLMMLLAITVIGFGASLGFSLIGLFFTWDVWLWLSLGMFVVSLVILVGISVLAAFTARNFM